MRLSAREQVKLLNGIISLDVTSIYVICLFSEHCHGNLKGSQVVQQYDIYTTFKLYKFVKWGQERLPGSQTFIPFILDMYMKACVYESIHFF